MLRFIFEREIMNPMRYRAALAAVLILLVAFAAPAKEKIKIEKLDDLPRHTYTIDMPAVELLGDEKALMQLAAEVKKDLEADLDTYEIDDATTMKGYYHNLGTIALIEGDYDTYLMYLEKRKHLEDKEAARLTKGLFAKAYIEAKATGKEGKAFKKELKRIYAEMINPLPYEIVGDELKASKGSSEIVNEALILGMIQSQVQPVLDQSGGEMSKDMATGLISQAYALQVYIPNASIVTEVLAAYIDEHHVDKPDIWADRDFDLGKGDGKAEVRVGIWDSGVDAPIFKSTMWTNPEEVPNNGKDDDGNGYVDDVHGIAYDLDSNPVPELLYPIGALDERPQLQSRTKGLLDLQANIDSKEAQELKKTLKGLQPEEVNPFLEGLSKYGNYSHGTHVAGIAVRGNPYIRVIAARMTYSHKSIPPEPTIEKARKDSAMMRDVVAYFQEQGVRVVNMSWGESLGGVESALEMNNAGGTPEERKELARQIFEISKGGLYEAIKG
ncbi:S8 family serine peptidase, partial [bacterium]|nr:S8 family serine peptidase [bacterium]